VQFEPLEDEWHGFPVAGGAILSSAGDLRKKLHVLSGLLRLPSPSFVHLSCIFRAFNKKKNGFAFFVCEAKQTR
jgi:hypothetical protein